MADVDKLKESFRQESAELLDEVEHVLLDLENKSGDQGLIKQVYRTVHTLKGSATMFDFAEVENFLHLIEHFLDAALKQELSIEQKDISRIFKSLDQASLLINESEQAYNNENTSYRVELTNYFQDRLKQSGKSGDDIDSEADMPEVNQWQIHVTFPNNIYEEGPDPAELFADLDELGRTQYEPDPDSFTGSEKQTNSYLTWKITLTSACKEQDIRDVFLFVEDDCELSITKAEEPAEKPDKAHQKKSSQSPGNSSSDRETDYIKVNSATLDELLNLVGELVINQSRLNNLTSDEEVSYQLQSTVEDNERLVDSLQSDIMQMRMLQVDTLSLRFQRMVRDIAESMGKQVTYRMEGGETELDKSMLENLVDPVMHLLRNAVDHGIEAPEDRTSAGKPTNGTILISAYQEGGEFVLKLHDDGKGIDPEKVFESAVKKKLVTGKENLSREQKMELIFNSGFSTSDQVTHISGRGMGMDVVKKAIDGMNGDLSISSEPGKFTVFTIRLPLTLAISECLMVKTGNQVFGIPVAYIERVQDYAREKTEFRERPLIKYEDDYIPFVRLHSVFNTGLEHPALEKMVLIRHQGKPMGILTDTIIGNMQAVMKPLPPMFATAPAISSSTILGDGSVGLILDVADLASLCRKEEQDYLQSVDDKHLNNTKT